MTDVISNDGTRIAFQRSGSGPSLILVDGALGSSALGSAQRLAKMLDTRFTVITYDRRGRGASGDGAAYTVDLEIDDVAALIHEAAGGSSGVYGISSGAALALEAALRIGERVTRLALYEPPYDDEQRARDAWREYTRRLGELLAEGRRGDAVALFMTHVGAPEDQVAAARRSPMWPMFEAVAPTLAYDAAVLGEDRTVPVERARGVRVPTLVMNGSETMPFMPVSARALAQAIPGARYLELPGQRHDVDPAALAPALTEFFEGATRRRVERAA